MTTQLVTVDHYKVLVAKAFSKLLAEDLGEETMRQVVERNRTPEYRDVCASHDFCDANEVMTEAMEAHGLDPFKNVDLWSAAWDEAKQNEFYL